MNDITAASEPDSAKKKEQGTHTAKRRWHVLTQTSMVQDNAFGTKFGEAQMADIGQAQVKQGNCGKRKRYLPCPFILLKHQTP